MSQIENLVNTLVLGFFSKINANVTEKNGLFDVTIPEQYWNFFGTKTLKMTFDEKIAQTNICELIAPGSNVLFKIINSCINYGSIIHSTISSKILTNTNYVIRFYFYVLFEGILSQTELCYIDVDVKSKNIITIDNTNIVYNKTLVNNLTSDDIDYCYIASIDHVKKIMKFKQEEFIKKNNKMKDEELKLIDNEYDNKINELEKLFHNQDNKTQLKFSDKSNDIIFDINKIRNEQEKIKLTIRKKYAIVIDFALILANVITIK